MAATVFFGVGSYLPGINVTEECKFRFFIISDSAGHLDQDEVRRSVPAEKVGVVN
jgi:hypothetical protein